MIATAGVNIILCSQQHSKAAAMLAETVFSLDDVVMERLASNSNEVIYSSPAKPKDAAYMIFTSGSTGEPKVKNVETFVITGMEC
jgi:acyl-coenzyme A synthetase/AMP-(fatty) acid ligase